MRQLVFYGLVFLLGLVTVVGVGVTTFLLGERLLSQEVSNTGIPELGPDQENSIGFELVVSTMGTNPCSAHSLTTMPELIPPDLELILVGDYPDKIEPNLVSFSGYPVIDRCANRATDTVTKTC